jgi:hypothetical protein
MHANSVTLDFRGIAARMRAMDQADQLLSAVQRLESALQLAESRAAGAGDDHPAARALRRAFEADVTRMRSELQRLRREYAANVAAYLRC